jgi:hypothetical protein
LGGGGNKLSKGIEVSGKKKGKSSEATLIKKSRLK